MWKTTTCNNVTQDKENAKRRQNAKQTNYTDTLISEENMARIVRDKKSNIKAEL